MSGQISELRNAKRTLGRTYCNLDERGEARRGQILFILFAALTLQLLPEVCHGEEIRKRFEQEAPRKWAEYYEFAKGLQGSWSSTAKNRTDNTVVARDRLQIKRSVHGMLFSNEFLGPSPEPRQHFWVKNNSYAFEIRRKTDKDPWIVSRLQTKLKEGKNPPFDTFLTEKSTAGFCPFSVFRAWLPDFIKNPGFQILEMKETRTNAGPLVRMEFRYNRSEKEKQQKAIHCESGWVVLDPARFWMVREYEVNMVWTQGQKGTVKEKTEFKENAKGYPILTKTTRLRSFPTDKVDQEEITECKLEERVAGPDEFSLSAFGISEPKGIRSPKSTPWYLWLALIAGICFLVAFLFRRQAKAVE